MLTVCQAGKLPLDPHKHLVRPVLDLVLWHRGGHGGSEREARGPWPNNPVLLGSARGWAAMRLAVWTGQGGKLGKTR